MVRGLAGTRDDTVLRWATVDPTMSPPAVQSLSNDLVRSPRLHPCAHGHEPRSQVVQLPVGQRPRRQAIGAWRRLVVDERGVTRGRKSDHAIRRNTRIRRVASCENDCSVDRNENGD